MDSDRISIRTLLAALGGIAAHARRTGGRAVGHGMSRHTSYTKPKVDRTKRKSRQRMAKASRRRNRYTRS